MQIKKIRLIRFNCAPKLSDFKIDESKSKVSVFEKLVNSISLAKF